MGGARGITAAVAAGVATLLLGATAVHAAFPGQNGRVAFTKGTTCLACGGIATISPDGSGRTSLSDSGSAPAWSPDGSKIAFMDVGAPFEFDIWVMNADGSGRARLTNGPPGEADPSWSPDGTRLLFSRRDATDSEIWVMNADGSGQARLTDNAVRDDEPVFSPDGSRIAFRREHPSDTWDIWTMNPDGSGQTNLRPFMGLDESPDWSPDGSKLAFAHNFDIWVMNADGSGATEVLASGDGERDPAFSPDGQRIAFTFSRAADFDIRVMAADGSGPQNLTDTRDDFEFEAAWQPLVNRPPDCSGIRANPSVLWPPNHKLHTVALSGATDPDADAVVIRTTGITNSEPDGAGQADSHSNGTDTVLLRAERDPKGNGRTYTVAFRVVDEHGASCTGTVNVRVPRHKA